MLFGDRFPHGSRNMANSSGVRSDGMLISSTNENPAVTQGMNNIERWRTTKEFKAHGEEDLRKTTMDVMHGDVNACVTALEAIEYRC